MPFWLLWESAFSVLIGAILGAYLALATPLGMERFGASLHGEVLAYLSYGFLGALALAVALGISSIVLACKLRNARAELRRTAT